MSEGIHISLVAETLSHIGSFPITNTLIMSLLSSAVLVVIAAALSRRRAAVPHGVQNVAEVLVDSSLSMMDSVTNDRQKSLRFFPLVFSLFIFILTSNWLGLLPGVGTIGLEKVVHGETEFLPLFRSTNADLNVTLALAIVSVIATQVFGIVAISAVKYAKRFFNFKNPIFTFVGLIELVSELAKFVSFSFRLFGNVFAGEVLLVVIAFLIPYLVPLPFMFLEVFVGLIQAFIFAILTLVFLTVATTEEAH